MNDSMNDTMSNERAFCAALLNPDMPVPHGITSWNGSDPAQRFAVYRNNVTVSLVEALCTAFPVVRAMVGDDFFREMARVFLRAQPPRSPVLATYGTGFPAFIAQFPPAATLAYLPDLARLEAARTQAYHAADAASLPPQAFASTAETALPGLRVKLHPTARILASPYAIVSLWAAHQGLLDLETLDPLVGEDALVLRPEMEVQVLLLPPGTAVMLTALDAGLPLGEAALHAAETPGFSLPDALGLLITSGVATHLTLEPEDAP